ncbi:MAG TPA: hypothetical protein VFW48_02405, partial [Solirubrobacterales bacterium]|nr:hypothetical protein [Solirubrobacterales bacterium]
CSVDTPAQFFEQAAGHPPVGFTQFIVKHEPPGETPVDELKTVRVDLPVGLSVNPGATPQCPLATFEADPATCPLGSGVGYSVVTASVPPLGVPIEVPEKPTVYNIVPPAGEPARFGLHLLGNDIFLRADVAWDGDYHEGFTIDVPSTPFESLPLVEGGVVLKNRLVFDGRSGDGTFISTPSTCLGPAVSPFEHVYSTWLLASGVTEEEDPGYEFPADANPPFESRIPPGTSPKECDTVPFVPSIETDPNTAVTDSPSGATVEVTLPHQTGSGGTDQETSHLRTAKVTLPAGMGLNPSAANGLQACTDGQFGKGTRNPTNSCPAASKIGTVSVATSPLPEGPLTGDVYVGQQLSRDPASGDAYRIFVEAKSDRYGVVARLIGNVSANPQTGQLTTTFAENPQVPFDTFSLSFNEGPHAPLTSPPTCGPHATATEMTPWTTAVGSVPPGQEGGPSDDPPATPGDEFELTDQPAGGGCAKTLAERPFSPSFGARTAEPKAGAYRQFSVDVARSDGNQELKGVNVDLPPGLTAKLAGVRYCPEATVAAAAANSGAAEAASPSCPASSLVGSASVAAGSGSDPFRIGGKAFLTGPYHGAPVSLAVITPATAGPFDLGSVVVRVALFVDPGTAQVHAVSDPIPHVFGGALLDIRSVAVTLDRPKFSLNPTNCSPMAVGGTLRGGGGNPLDPGAFSSHPVSAPFQVEGCDRLDFKPKLFMRVFGGTQRGKSPKLRAILVAREGDANIGRAAVTLPKALILEQSSLSNVCTRIQFAAHDCPKSSIYGYATAETPLLDGPLKGPVYLRSSDNELPDMVAALRGQVDVELAGRIDSAKGRLRTTYDVVPDVPVSKFTLVVRGGKKQRGLLVNTTNLCRKGKPFRVIARFRGQNGKKANQRPKLRAPCKKKARKGKGGKRGQR